MTDYCEHQRYAGTQELPPEWCENEVVPGECFCECHLPVEWRD